MKCVDGEGSAKPRRGRWVLPLVVLVAFGLVGTAASGPSSSASSSASSSSSSSSSRYEEIQRKIAEAKRKIAEALRREREALTRLNASGSRKASLDKVIHDLSVQLAVAEQALAKLESELGVASGALSRKSAEVEASRQLLAQHRQAFNRRVARAYMFGGTDYLRTLVSSADLQGVAVGSAYVRRALSVDAHTLQAFAGTRDALAAEEAQLAARRDELLGKVNEVDAQRKRVAELKARNERALRQIQSDMSLTRAQIDQLRRDRASYEKAMRELEAESSRITALLRGAQKGQRAAGSPGKGILVWPTTGRVTSGYGWRTHPVFGDRRFHSGVDISAPEGQAVVASAAGTVVYAGSQSGYGNVIVIDHGNSLATLYAHLSAFAMKSGQKVSRSQRVGSVGHTGYATGPHLHFEVRMGGEPTDPMAWF
ncbi:MAG: peptidoglycan DD-metalloendopeptidase family protein [Actinomycetota bacterium]